MDTKRQQKSNSTLFDFIIVGQGIAGSVLAITLIKFGYKVCVINKDELSSCSRVAAGIWNPIVFKRLTKSWLADDVVPELNVFYQYCEQILNTKLIHHRNIIKPFSEEQEKTLWVKKAGDSDNYPSYLDATIYNNLKVDSNYTVNSYSKVINAGNLDVANFLSTSKSYITDTNYYLNEVFSVDELNIESDKVEYKNIIAKYIIFCEGHLITQNPFFSWIPMKPAKGEVITIYSENILIPNDIFNKGFFIMPLGNNLYKVGATYEWNDLSDDATEKGKAELITKLNTVITTPYQIVKHEAGIRPSVIDRRPLVGRHPIHNNVLLFNGFGTKAVMLAPYFANILAKHIKCNNEITNDVNPQRFYKN